MHTPIQKRWLEWHPNLLAGIKRPGIVWQETRIIDGKPVTFTQCEPGRASGARRWSEERMPTGRKAV